MVGPRLDEASALRVKIPTKPNLKSQQPSRSIDMALFFTPEQRTKGVANFQQTVGELGLTRRDFMKGLIAAGGVVPIGAAMYFGYKKLHGSPGKRGLIRTGDEGGFLVGEHKREH